MGMFSSKKKTYVATQINRMVGDQEIPNLNQKSLVDVLFDDKKRTTAMINNALHSHTTKFERAYRSAARGEYHYGTPNHNITYAAKGQDVVKDIIELNVGAEIVIEYFQFMPLNNLHFGWQKLTEDYGYNEFRNQITPQGGKKTWVVNMLAHVDTSGMVPDGTAEDGEQERLPDVETMANWERHPQDRYTPFRTDAQKTPLWYLAEGIEDGVEVFLVDEDGLESTLFFPLNTFGIEDTDHFHVKYRYGPTSNRSVGYFTYEYGQGTYSGLDSVHEGQAVGRGSFFPVVFFRHNRQNRTGTQYHDTAAYKSSVKLMKSMGMDYQSLGDSVNESPDANKLQQAVMMFAVPASSTDSVEIEYTFKFFDWLQKQSGSVGHTNELDGYNQISSGKAITIKDADFHCTLSYSKLVKRQLRGDLDVDEGYEHEQIQETRYRTVWRTIVTGVGDSRYTERVQITEPYVVELLQYRRQIRPGMYEEITVSGLSLRYHIFGDKGVTANIGSDKLLIPLDYNICRSIGLIRKERLYLRSLHMVFNSKVTVTVKWYERGAFKILLMVIILVITVVIIISSAGANTPVALAWAQGAYGALALAVLEILAVQFVVSFAIQKAAVFALREMGVDSVAVLAVVTFVAAVAGGYMDADWASYALMASNSLTAANQTLVQDQLNEYKSESQEFELMAEAKYKELEEISNLLNQYDLLDPRSFIGQVPKTTLGETPSALYERSVHTGNPGTLIYDYIESYVAISTQLPTFDSLVGDTFYGSS